MSKKWAAEGKKVSKKRWAEITEKFTCAGDILEVLYQDINLSSKFRLELDIVQASISKLSNKTCKKSLNKKERLEVYGK